MAERNIRGSCQENQAGQLSGKVHEIKHHLGNVHRLDLLSTGVFRGQSEKGKMVFTIAMAFMLPYHS